MKRTLCIIIALMMIVSITACTTKSTGKEEGSTSAASGTAATTGQPTEQNETEAEFPIAKDKITIKVLGWRSSAQGPWEDMQLIQKMEELTNIHFVFDTPVDAAYTEKKNLALASGDIPDVFMGAALTVQDEEMFGPSGALIPLESLIDTYAPHLVKRLAEDPSVKNAITASDGHIYALPSIIRTKTAAMGLLYINMTWLKNVGMSKPTTVDELYNVLKAFKDKDPNGNGIKDEIPITVCKPNIMTSQKDNYILGTTILNAFSGLAGGAGFDIKDGKVIYSAAEPFYKDYLMYLNKLFKEGLLDNEMFTQTPQNMYAKGKDGKVGVLTTSVTVMLNANKYDPHEMLDPLTSPANDKKVTAELPGITTSVFAITNKCKNPEAMMKWVDMFYRTVDEEVQGISGMSMFLGIHGRNWEYTDDTKKEYIRKSEDPNLTDVEYINKFVTPGGAMGFPAWEVTDAIPSGTAPLLLLKANESEKHYFPYMIPTFPASARYTKAESDAIAASSNDIYTYTNQMFAKFVIGEESFDKWDSYIANLKKMKIDELTKIMQDSYDRWKTVK